MMSHDSAEACENTEIRRLAVVSIGADIYSSRDEAIAACTLLMITELLSTQIQQWKGVLKGRIEFHEQLGIDGFSDGHRGSSSWVLLRFGMSTHNPQYVPRSSWHEIFLSQVLSSIILTSLRLSLCSASQKI